MGGIDIKLEILNQKASPAFYANSLASRPNFGFAGRIFIDTDNPSTGIYRDTGTAWIPIADPGAGTTGTLQQVTTNGNITDTGISVTSKGIGIGTTLPGSNRIDIHSSSGIQATFNGTGTTNAALQLQNAGVGKWTLQNNYNSAANDFVITDVLNTIDRLTITNAGVGTFTGNWRANQFILTNVGGNSGIFYLNNGVSLANYHANAFINFIANGEVMRLTNTGLMGLGTTNPITQLSLQGLIVQSSPVNYTPIERQAFLSSYYINSSPFLQYLDIGVNGTPDGVNGKSIIRFLTNTVSNGSASVEQMRLDSVGLGIGTTSPAYKLDVSGTANISNSISIGNTVTAAVAIASTHKVSIIIGGVQYYLLASNI